MSTFFALAMSFSATLSAQELKIPVAPKEPVLRDDSARVTPEKKSFPIKATVTLEDGNSSRGTILFPSSEITVHDSWTGKMKREKISDIREIVFLTWKSKKKGKPLYPVSARIVLRDKVTYTSTINIPEFNAFTFESPHGTMKLFSYFYPKKTAAKSAAKKSKKVKKAATRGEEEKPYGRTVVKLDFAADEQGAGFSF